MIKNFDDISNNHINDEELAWLEFHILVVGYLKKGLSYFTKISTEDDNKIEVDVKELKRVSDFKKEKKDKKNLLKG